VSNIISPTISPISLSDDALTPHELKVLLRLGWLKAHKQMSKHSGGYRYYEVTDGMLSEWEIAESHVSLQSKGLVSRPSIWKYNENRKELHFLIDLSKYGILAYFHFKSMTRAGLEIYDLDFLDQLLDNQAIELHELNAKVLLNYVDHVDLGQKTGYNISQFGRSVLEKEKQPEAISMLDDLKNSIDSSSRAGMSNSDIELMYSVVRKLEEEINTPKPRQNLAKAELHVLFQVVQVIGVAAGVVSAILAFIQYLG
jgi:hypothetical protein